MAVLHMDVDAGLVELVDERFVAIKRQILPRQALPELPRPAEELARESEEH
jgi:hypothetical protein